VLAKLFTGLPDDIASQGDLFVSKSILMKRNLVMKKLIIGMLTACALCFYTATADAAVVAKSIAIKAIQNAKSVAGKACDGAANVIWRNKGAVAVGATAVAVATKPEVFVGGATTIATSSYGGMILFYLIAACVVIVGIRYLLRRFRVWKLLPLVVLGLLLCGGVAQAGMIDHISIPEIECGAIKSAWWNIITVVLLVISLFTGGAT